MDQADTRTDEVAGRYRLGRVLTADRRRRVHEGWDTRLRRAVAVVLVAPAAGTDPDPTLPSSPVTPIHLHRPGLVELYDGGVHGHEVFLICQRVPGPTLASLLTRRWTATQLADLVHRLARTLEPVHRSGAAHGALTPDRVLLGGPRPMIAECGVAALVERWSGLPEDTGYRAPEQSTGHTGSPADVFALGRILLDARLRPFSTGARDLRALATRMTATEPSARPEIRQVAADLAVCRDRATNARLRRPACPVRIATAAATAAGLVLGATVALGAVEPGAGGGSALVAPREPPPLPALTRGRLPVPAEPVDAHHGVSPVVRTPVGRTSTVPPGDDSSPVRSVPPASSGPSRTEPTAAPSTTTRPTTPRTTRHAAPSTTRPTAPWTTRRATPWTTRRATPSTTRPTIPSAATPSSATPRPVRPSATPPPVGTPPAGTPAPAPTSRPAGGSETGRATAGPTDPADGVTEPVTSSAR
ncbi:hypothetical protein ACFPK1_16525 [Actinomycetospora rhizophila]|uniref:Protein kinase domain-containing protein n=1 Tax=Actinomycetospora rhizophila TaxID=1416876 RepID=A0ABV9ZE34_9PSEU